MSDGGSSSSRHGSGVSVIYDNGKTRGACGYCKSTNNNASYSSISHGMWADTLTVDDYQELLDRGWRRSGCYVYRPEMDKTCCPSYTIRLKAADFVPSKEQLRVLKKMKRYLDGETKKGSVDLDGVAPSTATITTVPAMSARESSTVIYEKMSQENEFINYLSNTIDKAVNAYVRSCGTLPSTVELPKASVRKVTSKTKRKLAEIAEDLSYTSNIAFQIAALLKRIQNSVGNGESLDISPNIVAELLAGFLEKSLEHISLIIKACNGHLNFYSTAIENDVFLSTSDNCIQTSKENDVKRKQSCPAPKTGDLPCKRQRRMEIKMKRSSFDPEEFALYKRYQMKVHNDKPEKVTEESYIRFLVDTPLVFVPSLHSSSINRTVPSCGFGSFHQQYIIDGKLVAVGVVDVLPKCLSSKYLFWDPDLPFLSLGKYSALQEINWVKEVGVHCPFLQYYYLGYYIHSCSKMRYKAAYHPSELLCPLRYEWVPIEIARPLLDKRPYVVLSDYKSLNYEASAPQLRSTTTGQSSSPEKDEDGPGNDFYDEDEDTDFESEDSDSYDDYLSGSETFTDDLEAVDIRNVMINVNGSVLTFKDLQRKFGPIDKRQVKKLEIRLQNYVKAVGQELSSRIHYAVG